MKKVSIKGGEQMNKDEIKKDFRMICTLVREIESIAQRYMDPHPLKKKFELVNSKKFLRDLINRWFKVSARVSEMMSGFFCAIQLNYINL